MSSARGPCAALRFAASVMVTSGALLVADAGLKLAWQGTYPGARIVGD